jgi:hypothetical protein
MSTILSNSYSTLFSDWEYQKTWGYDNFAGSRSSLRGTEANRPLAIRVNELLEKAGIQLEKDEVDLGLELTEDDRVLVVPAWTRAEMEVLGKELGGVSAKKKECIEEALQGDEVLVSLLKRHNNLFESVRINGFSQYTSLTIDLLDISDAGKMASDKLTLEMNRVTNPSGQPLCSRVYNPNEIEHNPQIVEDAQWIMNVGAEALQNHSVMSMYPAEQQLPGSDQTIDEYGFGSIIPAQYGFSQSLQVPPRDLNDMDMNRPKIRMYDAVHLQNLTLEERKSFLNQAQSLINKTNINLDARQLRYEGIQDEQTGNISIHITGITDDSIREQIESLFSSDSTLQNLMKISATKTVSDKDYDIMDNYYYEISVVDDQWNILPDGGIILTHCLSGKQVLSNVETIRDKNRQEVLDIILQGNALPITSEAISDTKSANVISQILPLNQHFENTNRIELTQSDKNLVSILDRSILFQKFLQNSNINLIFGINHSSQNIIKLLFR